MSSVLPAAVLRFEIDDEVELPLGDVLAHGDGTICREDAESTRFAATFFDTPGLRLSRAGITVQLHTGHDRQRWHVAIPAQDAALLVDMPAVRSAATVPAVIRRLVWARTLGEDLRPVARGDTERTTHRLADANGQLVAEIADDRVRARRVDDPVEIDVWRVVGVRAPVPEAGAVIAAALQDAGAHPVDDRSDVFRLWRGEGERDDTGDGDERLSPESPAGDVFLRYIDHQREQMTADDPRVRLGAAGSVHRMRVATRRLRSALQTFQPVLEKQSIAPLRVELRWLAGELGIARDAEVMRERMLQALEKQEAGGLRDSIRGSVDTELTRAGQAAYEELLGVLDTERYRRLLVSLHDLVTAPPLTAMADRPARRVLPRRVTRAYARLKSRVKVAHHATTPAERDTQLHEARKAAKRARYAGEALAESFGNAAGRFAVAMENIQEELGEHQDSVVMRARIEELARRETNTTAAFAYGRLYAGEERRGELAAERFEIVWCMSKKKALRAWLD